MDKILFLLLINYVFLAIKIENFYQLLNDFSYDFIFRDNNNIKEKFNNIFLNNNNISFENDSILFINKNQLESENILLLNKDLNTTMFEFQLFFNINPNKKDLSYFSIFFINNIENNNYLNFNSDSKFFGFSLLIFTEYDNKSEEFKTSFHLLYHKNESLNDVIFKEPLKKNKCFDYSLTNRTNILYIRYNYEKKHFGIHHDSDWTLLKFCTNYFDNRNKQNDYFDTYPNFNNNYRIGYYAFNKINYFKVNNKEIVGNYSDNIKIYKQRLFNMDKNYSKSFVEINNNNDINNTNININNTNININNTKNNNTNINDTETNINNTNIIINNTNINNNTNNNTNINNTYINNNNSFSEKFLLNNEDDTNISIKQNIKDFFYLIGMIILVIIIILFIIKFYNKLNNKNKVG